jgi:hypothetical protein
MEGDQEAPEDRLGEAEDVLKEIDEDNEAFLEGDKLAEPSDVSVEELRLDSVDPNSEEARLKVCIFGGV